MYAFTRQQRLLCAKQYRQVFTKADRLSVDGIKLLVRANEQGYPRLGMVVAKRQFPLAVQRNRIKRIVRESFRQNFSGTGNNPACDLVIIAYKPLMNLTNQQFVERLNLLWKRLRNLYEN